MAPNLEEEVKEHKDESNSSKSDRHWKRPLKKAKVSGDHPDGRGLSALEVPDVPPLVCTFFLLNFFYFVHLLHK